MQKLCQETDILGNHTKQALHSCIYQDIEENYKKQVSILNCILQTGKLRQRKEKKLSHDSSSGQGQSQREFISLLR